MRSSILTALLTAVLATGTLHAQETRAGVHASALELSYLNLTSGAGVHAVRSFPLRRGRFEASASIDRFPYVAPRKPEVVTLGIDASISAFRAARLHPYAGIGAGLIHFNADRVDTLTVRSPCSGECDDVIYKTGTDPFLRVTLIGIEADVARRIAMRAAVQSVLQRMSIFNGSSSRAAAFVGIEYRFR